MATKAPFGLTVMQMTAIVLLAYAIIAFGITIGFEPIPMTPKNTFVLLVYHLAPIIVAVFMMIADYLIESEAIDYIDPLIRNVATKIRSLYHKLVHLAKKFYKKCREIHASVTHSLSSSAACQMTNDVAIFIDFSDSNKTAGSVYNAGIPLHSPTTHNHINRYRAMLKIILQACSYDTIKNKTLISACEASEVCEDGHHRIKGWTYPMLSTLDKYYLANPTNTSDISYIFLDAYDRTCNHYKDLNYRSPKPADTGHFMAHVSEKRTYAPGQITFILTSAFDANVMLKRKEKNQRVIFIYMGDNLVHNPYGADGHCYYICPNYSDINWQMTTIKNLDDVLKSIIKGPLFYTVDVIGASI